MKKTLSSGMSWLINELSSLDLNEPTREQYARWLLEKATGQSFGSLVVHNGISESVHEKLGHYINELKQGKPLGYVLCSVPFCDLNLDIKPPILIPRMETEEWVDNLIHELKKETVKDLRILDLCTGSGCIALSLAYHLPEAAIIGVDINTQALALAEQNAQKNNLANVSFIHSDLFSDLTSQKFDLIVANPPYINESEYQELAESVRHWEDATALVAPDNGLAILKKIILLAPAWLLHTRIQTAPLWLEIGYQQADACVNFLKKNKYQDIKVHNDSFGNNRVVTGRVNEADEDTLSLSKKRVPVRRPS